MDIIIISSTTNISGGARQALYLAQSLQKKSNRVIFFTYPHAKIRSQDPSIEWVDLPTQPLQAYKAIMQKINLERSTVVHAFHNQAVKFAAYFGTYWYMKKMPIVCVAHRGVTARPNNPLPYLLPGIQAYTANSALCAGMLPVLWRKNKVHVVNNAVPENRLEITRTAEAVRKELSIAPDAVVIGNICNNNPLKGAGELLQAYAHAKNRLPCTSALLIIGATEERWGKLSHELGISEHIRFVTTQTVADYLQVMQLFVFSSYFAESQPNVILEAMSMGLPIIASNIGGVPELLEAECLFSPKNTAEMSDKIVAFISNNNLLTHMAIRNKKASLTYTSQNRLKHMLTLYSAAMAENTLRRGNKAMRKDEA